MPQYNEDSQWTELKRSVNSRTSGAYTMPMSAQFLDPTSSIPKNS